MQEKSASEKKQTPLLPLLPLQPYLLVFFLLSAIATFWVLVGTTNLGFLAEDFAYLRYRLDQPKHLLHAILVPQPDGQYRPVGHQLFFFITKLFVGPNATFFHTVQLCLHLLNCWLFFSISKRYWQKSSLFVGALTLLWGCLAFAYKPLAWASATNNLLLVSFVLMALWSSPRSRFSLAFYGLALLSREFAFLALPMIYACHKKIAPYLVLTLGYFAYRLSFLLFFESTASTIFTPIFAWDTYLATFIDYLELFFLHTILSFSSLESLPWKSSFAVLITKSILSVGELSLSIAWLLSTFCFVGLCYLAFKNRAFEFLSFPFALATLSLWPQHFMPEFLYFPSLAVFFMLSRLPFSLRFVPVSVLLLLLLVAGNFRLAQFQADPFQQRNKQWQALIQALESLPENEDNEIFFRKINKIAAGDVSFLPWYIDFRFPTRYPCLARNALNWQRTYFTKKLLQCPK